FGCFAGFAARACFPARPVAAGALADRWPTAATACAAGVRIARERASRSVRATSENLSLAWSAPRGRRQLLCEPGDEIQRGTRREIVGIDRAQDRRHLGQRGFGQRGFGQRGFV